MDCETRDGTLYCVYERYVHPSEGTSKNIEGSESSVTISGSKNSGGKPGLIC